MLGCCGRAPKAGDLNRGVRVDDSVLKCLEEAVEAYPGVTTAALMSPSGDVL
jgi:hypothetical protein